MHTPHLRDAAARSARRPLVAAAAVAVLAAASGCSLFEAVGLAPAEVDPTSVRRPADHRDEPPHVVVQHVLIACKDSDIVNVTRTRDEAERVANQVLGMAKAGRDFDELVRLYSDDRHADGAVAIANWGVLAEGDELGRADLARDFTKAAFSLGVGEIGLVPYRPPESPYGWHVVRRIR